MKKTIYTIGRDSSSDICLYDGGNLVSRYHAVLKVKKNGTYVIIDQSLNGTYINGVRITQGREVPVTRKDTVMFANVVELDWSVIPKTNTWVKPAAVSVFAVIAVAAGVCAAIFFPSWNRSSGSIGGDGPETTVFFPQKHSTADMESRDGDRISLKTLRARKRAEEIRQKQQEKARQDSIRNAMTETPVPETNNDESGSVKAEDAEGKNGVTENIPSAEPRQENRDTVKNSNINAIY